MQNRNKIFQTLSQVTKAQFIIVFNTEIFWTKNGKLKVYFMTILLE